MDLGLKGKVVLVTGAAQGIGFATASLFAAEGARVVINDINPATLDESVRALPGASGSVSDVSTEQGAETAVMVAVRTFGGLDILVNNAGISGRARQIEDVAVEDWRRILSVNLDAAFLVSKFAMPHLRRGRGAIVNVSSLSGKRGSVMGNNLAYSVAKAGIVGLTIALVGEAARDGVRVNGVAPGPTETPHMVDIPLESRKALVGLTPLRRFGKPQEIADLIVFLASERASFITGEVVNINGGIYFN
jgi:3-oxoacyl-[acyl-carrier protein] reductase